MNIEGIKMDTTYSKYVPVKMTEEMYAELTEVATRSGMNTSEAVREAVSDFIAKNR